MIALHLAILFGYAAASTTTPNHCCAKLSASNLADKVFYPHAEEYEQSISSYWSLQAQLTPNCVVQPKTPEDVSLAVKTLIDAGSGHKCKFAIRGGGHTPWAGASNIVHGVTVDLSIMNDTTYHPSNLTASVGPGARWKDVYNYLDPLKVGLTGGRAGSVGVAGLTVGGGNSFYAARYGFVCDNVANFEVVLANGSIVNANNHTHTGLFKALKGGTSNFGIVTRFDFYTFPSEGLWGGVVAYPNTTTHLQIPAFVNFTNHIVDDPYASVISFWAYSSFVGANIIENIYDYTKPVANPPVLQQFLSIPGNTSNDLRFTNVSDLTNELEQAYRYLDIFRTLTFQADERVMQKAVDLHNEFVGLANNSDGAISTNWTIVTMFQPIPQLFSQHSVARGGNVLGLDRANDNHILFLIDLSWQSHADDDLFKHIGSSMIKRLRDFAKSIEKDAEWVYLNYAYSDQSPHGSYGKKNVDFMKKVTEEYDPMGVFQHQIPGGFKLKDVHI